eukprot:CAMPEP_0119314984 /NCGR_PEP_ID=MMETSP1333-20130426/34135_1 /TAXON_ID=418940 /ORGANISM="Scyphosphaera apsteinii, Strain RCC1455" /LENGTH=334 /DNA_ID=CAMNT_0007320197 /DNA_START=55 /DNA_END=1059 /DNA_ORIENTATION=+
MSELLDAVVPEFEPKLFWAVIPRGAKVGEKLMLTDELFCILPDPEKWGRTMAFRSLNSGQKAVLKIEIRKEEGASLGVVLHGDPCLVREVSKGSSAAGLLFPGDEVAEVSGVSKSGSVKCGSVNGEAPGAVQVKAMLDSIIGVVNVTVRRIAPVAARPVLMHGFLLKRSPRRVVGIRAWQDRYCEISTDRITYYEVSDATNVEVQRGEILLKDLVGVCEDSKKEKRLSLKMKSKRIFEFSAHSAFERSRWAKVIRDLQLALLTETSSDVSVDSPIKDSGRDSSRDSSVEEELVEESYEELGAEARAVSIIARSQATEAKPVLNKETGEVAYWRM